MQQATRPFSFLRSACQSLHTTAGISAFPLAMLKRQRASSPIPSMMPEIPLLPSDPSPIDYTQHAMKRRRMVPPSLDGSMRGWNVAPIPNDADDGEESWYPRDDMGCSNHASTSQSTSQGTGEYTKFNSLLHDLHAEHQFRRMISPSSGSTIPFVANDHRGQPFLHSNATIHHPTPARQPRPSCVLPMPFSPPSPEPDAHPQDGQLSILKGLYAGSAPLLGTLEDVIPDEGQKVKENYAGANKWVSFAIDWETGLTYLGYLRLIRTLFLSRRARSDQGPSPESQ
ncbi:hypothetical protein EVG20_g377 [Dentipellis fragilis]|uniref:Uncharacterized protein n=1 Tax=Dentipellis fragilis TaxID=205917 RepID=A0A4Y9ZDI6_9AGAM|nr:hypothetical protein EVG20_g377 [Dentipellis fragilis]